ncbi:hypothetical protein FHG66_21210 [Rubellimicrobium rubrum]|uniref:Uncharacterized protein n=1 Tax=Rubellimicrobium rubrum TaxID=2585369 RepID=A0A5C4MI82_9RHOB|nr:hypothetical protein [Rubellimicrobium rubrum]TNC43082.1 hypothetical protein FHG66_21210 [Rubellimicrobium rubrum]
MQGETGCDDGRSDEVTRVLDTLTLLIQVKQTLSQRMQALEGDTRPDGAHLSHLQETAHTCGNQADALLVRLAALRTSPPLVRMAEGLFDYFRDTEEMAELLLELSCEPD